MTNWKRPGWLLLFQLLLTMIMTFGISIILSMVGEEWRYYMPSKALTIILVTMGICLLLGLPIRLNKKVNAWWLDHQRVAIAGVIVGFIVLVLTWIPAFQQVEQHYDMTMVRPNPYIAIPAWGLTAFCLLHFYPRKYLTPSSYASNSTTEHPE